jgi:hypothetical protein
VGSGLRVFRSGIAAAQLKRDRLRVDLAVVAKPFRSDNAAAQLKS